MKNWKTTFCGAVAALPYVLTLFGVEMPTVLSNLMLAGGFFGIGWFAADSNKSGS